MDDTRRTVRAVTGSACLAPLTVRWSGAAAHPCRRSSSSGPASWLPPNKQIRCAYAVRFAQVAIKCQMPVTAQGKQTMLRLGAKAIGRSGDQPCRSGAAGGRNALSTVRMPGAGSNSASGVAT